MATSTLVFIASSFLKKFLAGDVWRFWNIFLFQTNAFSGRKSLQEIGGFIYSFGTWLGKGFVCIQKTWHLVDFEGKKWMERERSDSHSWRKLSGKIPGIHPSVFHEFELTLQAPSTLKFSPLGFLKIDLFGRLPRAFESLEYGTNHSYIRPHGRR